MTLPVNDLSRGIDNCSGAWYKGLRVLWTTSFSNNVSWLQIEKRTKTFCKKVRHMYMASIHKIIIIIIIMIIIFCYSPKHFCFDFFLKLLFETILLPYKSVPKDRMHLNKGSNPLNPYLLIILLPIPCNKLPCYGYLCTYVVST